MDEPVGINILSDELNEPLTLTEVKTHLKIDLSNEDTLLNNLIKSAREFVEEYCNISLTEKQIEVYYNNIGSEIILPRAPLMTLDHFYYYSDTYVETEVTSSLYKLITFNTFTESRILLKVGNVYPTYTSRFGIKLILTVGIPSTTEDIVYGVPEEMKTEMLNLIAFKYENRQSEADIPDEILSKLYKYRLIPI